MKVEIGKATLYLGDSLHTMLELPDNSVDAIVTDPPYGLSFMGKKWDYDVPSVQFWAGCLRVLKPGGHLLAFAGTRTQHRMAVRIEDAGFEIRDMIAWVYGSGFPKSMDVSKAIDKVAGAEREVVGFDASRARSNRVGKVMGETEYDRSDNGATITAPATDAALQWQGWGTALKPALEPITVARKPLAGTVAANVLEYCTGALNIDGCRVVSEPRKICNYESAGSQGCMTHTGVAGHAGREYSERIETAGRWPANLIHDGSDEVLAGFPVTAPSNGAPRVSKSSASIGTFRTLDRVTLGVSDSGGSAARFFYCAKASKSDRGAENIHPTVKPTDLMRYLCRLVTPAGGVVLDPFMGSGSTGKAAMLEGFRFIGSEMSLEYFEIAKARIESAQRLKQQELEL